MIMVASTNADGTPKYSTQQISLTPNGREVVYGVNYLREITDMNSVAFRLAFHQDANNIAGSNESEVGVSYKYRF